MTNDLKLKYNLSNETHKPYNVYQEWDKTRELHAKVTSTKFMASYL